VAGQVEERRGPGIRTRTRWRRRWRSRSWRCGWSRPTTGAANRHRVAATRGQRRPVRSARRVVSVLRTLRPLGLVVSRNHSPRLRGNFSEPFPPPGEQSLKNIPSSPIA
jgi:hypothetical protein